MNISGWWDTANQLSQVTVRGVEELLTGASGRGSWTGNGRLWVAVHGLDGPGADRRAAQVLAAVRALSGVRWAELNRPLAQVVLSVQLGGPTAAQVGAVLQDLEDQANAEQAAPAPKPGGAAGARPARLPGDSRTTAVRAATVAADAVGLVAAAAGRALRVPRLPGVFTAAVTLVDHQPRLRRAVEHQLGAESADLLLALLTAAGQALTQERSSLAVDLALRLSLLAEAHAAAQAWLAHEPELAAAASCERPYPADRRPRPRPPGAVETYADRAAVGGLVGAAVLGAVTGRWDSATDAVAVAAPKATRTARESFAADLGRALAQDSAVLVLQEQVLRRLDRVDVLIIDPRALLSDELTVGQVTGASGALRVRIWAAAAQDVQQGLLGAGGHRVSALSPAHDLPDLPGALITVTAVPDPLAAAVLAAARTAQLTVISVDVQELGELRPGFDELTLLTDPPVTDPAVTDPAVTDPAVTDPAVTDPAVTDPAVTDPAVADPAVTDPTATDEVDAALLAAVHRWQERGATVALLAVAAHHGLAAADVGVAVHRSGVAPGWTADLLLPDLAAAWRVITAIPAAKKVSTRSVELSAAGTLLGSLLMLPGVRGRGPGPVIGAAGAGWWTGRQAARAVAGATLPTPARAANWHNLTGPQVQAALDAPAGPAENVASPPDESSPWRALGRALQGAAVAPLGGAASWVAAVREELSDPLTPILATGAAASAVLGSPVDAALVGAVMLGNAALSAVQRLRAEDLLRQLLAGQQTPARVITPDPAPPGPDSAPALIADREVAAAALQVGWVIQVRAGEMVPADARVLTADGVEVDESSLTGESLPVDKQSEPTPGAPLAERSCMLFEGTVVLTGTVTAVVTAVGAATEAGRAAAVSPAGGQHVGLAAQLGRLTSTVLPVTAAGGAAVTLLGLLRGADVRRAVTSGVSIAVAAVPEGLPLVATLAQQAAARRLGALGILVRSPRAVEALGRVDVVCFDKTGTLTQNLLQVREVLPVTTFTRTQVLGAAAASCPARTAGAGLASATDTAVLDAVAADPPARQAQLPFRAGRPFSAAVIGRWMYVKGAPELLVAAGADPAAFAGQVEQLATRGLRVLGVARRRLTAAQAKTAAADEQSLTALCASGLELLGLLGIADTPRPGAAGLLAALTDAGTGVRVITGDHPVTAAAIVADLGLPVPAEQIVTGPQWAKMSRAGQRRAAQNAVIFARMSPEQKVQVVQVLEASGQVCAMVGDGANDAAAIRAASIGVGVAAHGSDPARGAADVVLTDGRIQALTDALREGTQLWQRVQSAASVLLGGNAGEVAFTLIGTAITGRAPLNTRQLLLVNMFTDALPAAAVAVSPPRHHPAAAAKTSGAASRRGLDPAALWQQVAIRGAATTAGATAGWAMASLTGRPARASTVGLVALVASQLGQTLLDSRSPLVIFTATGSLVTLGTLISIPAVSQLLGCTPLGPVGWAQALAAATAATAAAAITPKVLTRLSSPPTQGAPKEPAAAATAPNPHRPATHTVTAPAPPTPPRKPPTTTHIPPAPATVPT